MIYAYGDQFAEFENLDIEDDKPTWPSPGSGTLKIEDKCEALFISATWKVVATVNGKVFSETWESAKPHDQSFIKNWSLQLLKDNYEKLRSLGVDVEGHYKKLGGNVDDL